ncbi:EamA family transporter [Cupriavidus sp. CP313]
MVLGTSFMGIAAYNSLLYCSLQTTTASNALLLNSLAPLLIVLLGAMFYRQRLNWNQGAGLILSFVGVLILVLQGQGRGGRASRSTRVTLSSWVRRDAGRCIHSGCANSPRTWIALA